MSKLEFNPQGLIRVFVKEVPKGRYYVQIRRINHTKHAPTFEVATFIAWKIGMTNTMVHYEYDTEDEARTFANKRFAFIKEVAK